jgi:hypothetical protein
MLRIASCNFVFRFLLEYTTFQIEFIIDNLFICAYNSITFSDVPVCNPVHHHHTSNLQKFLFITIFGNNYSLKGRTEL